MAYYLKSYRGEGRNMLPEKERAEMARFVRRLVAHGITRQEIAARAKVHKCNVTRLARPQIKAGKRVPMSRAYARAMLKAIIDLHIVRGIPLD